MRNGSIRDAANIFILKHRHKMFFFIHLFNMKYLLYTENIDLEKNKLNYLF